MIRLTPEGYYDFFFKLDAKVHTSFFFSELAPLFFFFLAKF